MGHHLLKFPHISPSFKNSSMSSPKGWNSSNKDKALGDMMKQSIHQTYRANKGKITSIFEVCCFQNYAIVCSNKLTFIYFSLFSPQNICIGSIKAAVAIVLGFLLLKVVIDLFSSNTYILVSATSSN